MHLLALDTRILLRPLFHSQNQLDTKRRIVLSYGNRVIFFQRATLIYKLLFL